MTKTIQGLIAVAILLLVTLEYPEPYSIIIDGVISLIVMGTVGYGFYLWGKNDFKVRAALSDMFGYRFVYRVKFTYIAPNGSEAWMSINLNFLHPQALNYPRILKKVVHEIFWENKPELRKEFKNNPGLRNGKIQFEPVTYLGWYKP